MEITASERLQSLRNELEITQAEVAKGTGLSYSAVQVHEGGRTPSKTSLKKYAVYYRVDEIWLLRGRGAKRPGETEAEQPLYNKESKPNGKVYPINHAVQTVKARDADGLWGNTRQVEAAGAKFTVTTHEPRTQPGDIGFRDAVQLLGNILDSGDRTITRAILSNLEAFSGAVDQAAQSKQRIAALENKIAQLQSENQDLRARVTDLEEKMNLLLIMSENKKKAEPPSTKSGDQPAANQSSQ